MMTLKRFHSDGTKDFFNDDSGKVPQWWYWTGCILYALHLSNFKVHKKIWKYTRINNSNK